MSLSSLFCIQVNGSKFCYVSVTIDISHLWNMGLNKKTVLFITIQFSMSIKLNYSNYCYLSGTIQINISHLLTHC